MSTNRTVSESDVRLIAAKALVDIRTVRRFFAGEKVYGVTRERIEVAMQGLEADRQAQARAKGAR